MSPSGPVKFQVSNSHVWVVATILDTPTIKQYTTNCQLEAPHLWSTDSGGIFEYTIFHFLHLKAYFREFSGGPVVKTVSFHYWGHRFDPWLGH